MMSHKKGSQKWEFELRVQYSLIFISIGKCIHFFGYHTLNITNQTSLKNKIQQRIRWCFSTTTLENTITLSTCVVTLVESVIDNNIMIKKWGLL